MRRRLSDGALETLAEIEAECRDGYADDGDYLAYLDTLSPDDRAAALGGEYAPGDHAALLAWEAERAAATHDAAGYPLTDGVAFPW
jgi:hypothetical protein